jgi:selenide,water dikinase
MVLAGGHSIDAPEPIFGLAGTGRANRNQIKTNDKARVGSRLFLTKPLGIGILTTAQKKGLLKDVDLNTAKEWMLTLNKIGRDLGKLDVVTALTDVTGFGLLGHLIEVCDGSGVSAEIAFNSIPIIPTLDYYISEKCIPGGTNRNFDSYGQKVSALSDKEKSILCDPQTSGGLLVAVDPTGIEEVNRIFNAYGLDLQSFGEITPASEYAVVVK